VKRTDLITEVGPFRYMEIVRQLRDEVQRAHNRRERPDVAIVVSRRTMEVFRERQFLWTGLLWGGDLLFHGFPLVELGWEDERLAYAARRWLAGGEVVVELADQTFRLFEPRLLQGGRCDE